ncbi:peptidyl-prolyl cis-trans isomerase A (cyclophilin A)/peptidyl-prolyl cis-trans isomerase B (cyclophilin B) [Pseudoduganella lurida]|uniref:Peptidyl-prolyl cis-trans isomerase n=1 Tax=Pseudoduganella lurida TaxID=1036180 RepID=A0A562RN82_9BURK|nr:peptidyl-prolyl cis-trans isomerase A (cyclophilin A)/peptidyl-prolyl cis-trans isomerase B (cyclophilin B) [Pseudoduganella lurida]
MHAKIKTVVTGTAALLLACGLAGKALAAEPQVELKTTAGDIVLELNGDKAPKSTANFLAYVKSGFYKDLIFHRVIDGFMIQAGGYTKDLKGRATRPNVPSESKNGLSNAPYTVAMARLDNPNSANSQFFINVGNNVALDYPNFDGVGYTVFGRVISGYEVVDKISKVLVDDKSFTFQNVPVIPVVIKSANVLKKPIQPKPVPGQAAESAGMSANSAASTPAEAPLEPTPAPAQ